MDKSSQHFEPLQQRHEILPLFLPGVNYSRPDDHAPPSRVLANEVFYAIPTYILKAMKDESSNLLSEKEMEIESSFAEHCKRESILGYFANKAILFPLLLESTLPTIANNPLCTPAHLAMEELGRSVMRTFAIQQLAYLGWLTSNPTYQQELVQLRDYWLSTDANPAYLSGRNLPKQFHGLPAQAHYSWNLESERGNTFLQFYRRWDLVSFATWELPIQTGANLGGHSQISQLMEIDHNPSIQLPATLKYPTSVPAQQLLIHPKIDHLREWHQILDSNRVKRIAEAFVIHFYQTVVLQQIFGSRLKRRQTMLDDLLAQAFENNAPMDSMCRINVDTIKKIRQWYQRRLKLCKTSM